MAERIHLVHGFGPFYREDSRLLILGSFPSVKSREASFYYGHPQNRFWAVLAEVFRDGTPDTLEAKKAFLTSHRIALYDVIESCSIIGSSDSSIEDVVVTDLSPILSGSQVGNRIFVNGGKAHALYQKFSYPLLGIHAVRLPSTSPANAAWSLQKLAREWSALLSSAIRESE